MATLLSGSRSQYVTDLLSLVSSALSNVMLNFQLEVHVVLSEAMLMNVC